MCSRILRCILISVLISTAFFSIFWLDFTHDRTNSKPVILNSSRDPVVIASPPADYNCCKPLNITLRKHIYFVKTHKTGSTTVQNIILRFALNHSLDIMNTIYFLYYQPFSDQSIYPFLRTPNNKYHVLASHVRYTSELRWYQYPNTPMVTIMRHPAKLFPSLYNYFHMNETTGMTFQQFMNAPVKPAFVTSSMNMLVYRGYNQMSYDLGFDLITSGRNQTTINEFIEKIDREFDFVMIMEHMEASLVLLANLMGWPLEYVAHLKMNVSPADSSNTYKLSFKDELTLLHLNHVDSLLYHHFLNKFRACVRKYGEVKMQRKIIQLRKLNQKLKHRCVAGERVGGLNFGYFQAIEYVPKNTSDLECVYATSMEIPFEIIVMEEQFKKLHNPRNKNQYYKT
ncbi:galactose-3-O-sulfotransferase 3-like [Planococcus citri]|uniref:galactose-3-O-sulfotransferase 3-like n=1 Tax=Planococcus citri TaxID=170843 RepID=UPI0031F875D4